MSVTEPPDHYRAAFIVMAAFAGSVTALSLLKWREMSWSEIGITLFVGFSFAIILVPWLAHDLAGIDTTNLRAICAIVYLGGASSNALMPLAIRRAKKLFGLEEVA